MLAYGLGALAVCAWATVVPPDWGHVKARADWFAIRLPPILQEPAIVLAPRGTSFVGPFLPADGVMIGYTRLRRCGPAAKVFSTRRSKPRSPASRSAGRPADPGFDPVWPSASKSAASNSTSVRPASRFRTPSDLVVACELTRGGAASVAAPPLKAGLTLDFASSGQARRAAVGLEHRHDLGQYRPRLVAEAVVRRRWRIRRRGHSSDASSVGARRPRAWRRDRPDRQRRDGRLLAGRRHPLGADRVPARRARDGDGPERDRLRFQTTLGRRTAAPARRPRAREPAGRHGGCEPQSPAR